MALDGKPDTANGELNGHLYNPAEFLKADVHSVTQFSLRYIELKTCSGFFGCRATTSGECRTKDDSPMVRHEIGNIDFALFASQIVMGFTTLLLKK